ncbi:AAA family ATPase [Enterococcus cecorum]|nr:AAA family ATPase [Enterococcus cecorum]CAI3312678.1 AAA family ATPase [Enterococcus cecorum]CAI3464878.1 AAA family ATPase [Enterococcus cecorum]CAI3476119.1 AAA family ATPase [Enterococcus cecorum]CAI3481040.1 AAA family ATPase [Enterococcus cecorum]
MANRIDKRANRSKELIQTLERFDNYIGYLPQLDILYEKQSIYSSDAARKNKAGFETVDMFFQNLVTKIQEIAKEVA